MFIDTIKAEFNSSWYAVNFLPVGKMYWNVLSFKCLELIHWKNSRDLRLQQTGGHLWDQVVGGTFAAVRTEMLYALQSPCVYVCIHTRVMQFGNGWKPVSAISWHEALTQGKAVYALPLNPAEPDWLLVRAQRFPSACDCGSTDEKWRVQAGLAARPVYPWVAAPPR